MLMITEVLTEQALTKAVAAIKAGELVAFPTETVYGLGANALDATAVKKVYQAKGRPSDNPLIVHVSGLEMVKQYVKQLPPKAEALVQQFWPGPLTFIFAVDPDTFPAAVTGGLTTVAFRMPDNELTLQLIKTAGVPLVGPSANTSGKPSPTSAQHVYHDLQGKIAYILDDGPTKIGVESTVLDLSVANEVPTVLRPGAVTKSQLETIIGEVVLDQHLVGAAETPKAPGMKYKHYSPEAPVWIINEKDVSSWRKAIAYGKAQQQQVGLFVSHSLAQQLSNQNALTVSYGEDTVENATKMLFAGLRSLDEQGAEIIFAQGFSEQGLGAAYMNRLKKAANQNFFS
jgi:L-threonylcarbamoyladenylate synthase